MVGTIRRSIDIRMCSGYMFFIYTSIAYSLLCAKRTKEVGQVTDYFLASVNSIFKYSNALLTISILKQMNRVIPQKYYASKSPQGNKICVP